jgi:N-formylglutamate deformylase
MNNQSEANKFDQKLPILISVPHGGDEIPPELAGKVALTKKEIFEDGDALTRQIYSLKHEVLAYLDTPIARAFVDLNRSPELRPPQFPDGVVKTETANKIPIYNSRQYPDDHLIKRLLKNYYFPYHDVLEALQTNKNIVVALDCHSMMAEAPAISLKPGEKRPLICLSNRGDQKGYPKDEGAPITCPPETIQLLAKCFRKVFADMDGQVKINDPFSGGYIVQAHGKGIIPWIQVEINRKLYLAPPYFDAQQLTVSPERIFEIREKLLNVTKMFLNYLM